MLGPSVKYFNRVTVHVLLLVLGFAGCGGGGGEAEPAVCENIIGTWALTDADTTRETCGFEDTDGETSRTPLLEITRTETGYAGRYYVPGEEVIACAVHAGSCPIAFSCSIPDYRGCSIQVSFSLDTDDVRFTGTYAAILACGGDSCTIEADVGGVLSAR